MNPWHLPAPGTALFSLAAQAGLPIPVAEVLHRRGFTTPSAIHRILDQTIDRVHGPESLGGTEAAAKRLAECLRTQKPICIYGDYDVDGTTGTSTMIRVLRELGGTPHWFVPHRLREGYGVHSQVIKRLYDEGIRTVVTVDCGITGLHVAKEAQAMGMEWIVTDHHHMASEMPDADVVVHPRLPDGHAPFTGLCGSGVAWKLAWAVAKELHGPRVTGKIREALEDCLVLAALGTVADVVPLREENRAIVRAGLAWMPQCRIPGVHALLNSAGLMGKEIRAEDIAFKLGPAINAAGRLDHATDVIDMLTNENLFECQAIADHLMVLNDQRKEIEKQMVEEAIHMVDESPGIVLHRPQWHHGVMGIVASRIAEMFHRPTLIIAGDGDAISGSGRSVPGFDLHAALKGCADIFERFGGHEAAAGFRLPKENLPALKERFSEEVVKHFKGMPPSTGPIPEATISLNDLNHALMASLDRLEPTGCQWPAPLFVLRNAQAINPMRMGANQNHLSLQLRSGPATIRAIWWKRADRFDELIGTPMIDALVRPKRNTFKGRTNIELEIVDIQSSPF